MASKLGNAGSIISLTYYMLMCGACVKKGHMDTPKLKKMTGGYAIAEMLRVHGVKVMFGMGGFQLLPVYDAINQLGNVRPRHIHVNDEKNAAFAADGFARVAGHAGVCDGTLGPGATNLVTGIVEAYTAGMPMVALVGDSNRDHSGKNMTQETPRQAELLSLITKDFIKVERGHRIPEQVRRAFSTASKGRPGPVVLNIPENVSYSEWDFNENDFYAVEQGEMAGMRIRPDSENLKRAAELIRKANRPVLLIGGGVHISKAYNELITLAENLNIPVAHTLSGKGAIPCRHPLCMGLFGRFDRMANSFIRQSDLIIALGFKFGEIATIRYSLVNQNVDVIQVDILPEEIGRHQHVSVGLWADCKAALTDLAAELGDYESKRIEYVKEVAYCKREWQRANESRLKSDVIPIDMARICYELSNVIPPDGFLVADGGFAAHWTGLLYDTPSAGRGFVANRGNASIGYGLPGGIGVKLAAEDRPVVAMTGDVGFNMSMGELETAIREKVALTVIVINNAAAGYVKGLQHAMFEGRYQSSDLHEINYAEVAKAMGCHGVRIEVPSQFGGAVKDALSERVKPVLIDVVVTRDPAKMLPAADARTSGKAKTGDRLI
jgi:acetolactate synthase I/II/III large subunit